MTNEVANVCFLLIFFQGACDAARTEDLLASLRELSARAPTCVF